MSITRHALRSTMGLTMWAGFALTAQAQLPAVTAEGACQVMPLQPGVIITTPPPNQIAQCKVEPVSHPTTKATMGFVVRDPSGRPIRQFVSYDGKTFNIRAFYLDGIVKCFPSNPKIPCNIVGLGQMGANGVTITRTMGGSMSGLPSPRKK